MRTDLCLLAALLISGCNSDPQLSGEKKEAPKAAPASLRFDTAPDEAGFRAPPVLQAQVRLDRIGFSSGVIDGKEGASFRMAVRGFQRAQGLSETGQLDDATQARIAALDTLPATRRAIIPAGFAAGPFIPSFPDSAEEQARLPALGYRSLMEALAERFHTTQETLIALNAPATPIGAGAVIRVPNVENPIVQPMKDDVRGWGATLERLGVSSNQPRAADIVVDKSEGWLRVFDAEKNLIAQFPATMGSAHDPLPIGTWDIKGVSRNPDFHYNPKLFWDVRDSKEMQVLKPGPNSPVGVVWIDLSKPHYGIHGTSEPQQIGHAESHGCVRLTNWDAARLAQMVRPGTVARFVP